jgi:hypothetical protein
MRSIAKDWSSSRSDEGETQSRSGAGQMDFLRSHQFSLREYSGYNNDSAEKKSRKMMKANQTSMIPLFQISFRSYKAFLLNCHASAIRQLPNWEEKCYGNSSCRSSAKFSIP